MVKTRGWWLGSQGLPTKYLIQSHYIPLKPPFFMVKSPSLMLKPHFFIRFSRSKVLASPTSFWQFDNAIFQLLSTNFSRWKSNFAGAALHGAGFRKFFAPTKVSRSPRAGSGEVAVSGLHVIFWWPNLVPILGMFSHHNCVCVCVRVCVSRLSTFKFGRSYVFPGGPTFSVFLCSFPVGKISHIIHKPQIRVQHHSIRIYPYIRILNIASSVHNTRFIIIIHHLDMDAVDTIDYTFHPYITMS